MAEEHRRRIRLTRDVVMFSLGAGTFVYEVLSGGERAPVLYASLGLMGVTAFLRGVTITKEGPK